MFKLRFCIILFAGLLNDLVAENDESIAYFQVHSYHRWNNLFYSDNSSKSERIEIALSSASFSKKQKVLINSPIQFYSELENTNAPIATISLPKASEYLVIFVHHEYGKNIHPIILPFSDRKNDLRIINLTGYSLHGVANGQRFRLNFKEQYDLILEDESKLSLGLKARKDGRWLMAHQQTYYRRQNQKSVLLLFPPILKGSASIYARLLPTE